MNKEIAHSTDTSASLHDEILTFLRHYIVEDNLKEGEKVPEKALCEQLGISRTPLREALKVLSAEGFVELLPNRGARVRSLKADEAREIFEVLAGLESLAGRLACKRITDEQVSAIEALHLKMYSAFISKDLTSYFDLNQRIHHSILIAAGNKALMIAHTNYARRIQRLRFHANRVEHLDRWSQAMREHELILAALTERDGPRLGEVLTEHLMNKCTAALDIIKSKDK